MKTEYEQDCPQHLKSEIDRLATELLSGEPDTRASAAQCVSRHGFTPYIGGHHVAVHKQVGDTLGPRLAIITHDAEDWQ
jgi:hypothetical protein